VEQLIDGPDGPQVVTMTSAEIAELEPERKAMRAAARENEDLEDFLDLLNAAGEVHIDDPRVVAGLNAFVSAGILTAARRGEIADSF
jgi:hypothetical protein